MSRLILPSRKLWTPPQRQRGVMVLDAYRFDGGGSGGGAGSTWSPTDKHANITLSNSDLTATSAAGGWKMIRGTLPHSTGRWYAEFSIDSGVVEGTSSGAGDVFVGTDNGSGSLGSYPGSSSSGRGYYCRGAYYGGSSGSANVPWGAGRVIGLAYDADLGKMWFSRDGVWFGDPAANTGVAMTGVPAGQLLAFGPFTSGAVVTLRTAAADFSYSPPSGYSAWG